MKSSRPSMFKIFKFRVKALYLEYVKGDVFQAAYRRWYADEGDRFLRYVYPLNASSIVFDVGGYHGDFAQIMHARYGCKVWLFEPVARFHHLCATRFVGNDAVKCLPYGLADRDETLRMAVADDASGAFNPRHENAPAESVQLRSFAAVIAELGLQDVHLMKVNIEGGEFPLLEHLLATGLIRRTHHLQVQFHNFIPGADARRDRIRRQLAETHTEKWCYPFIWESWSRR